MYYGRKMKIDDTNIFSCHILTQASVIFLLGGRVRPQILLFFVVYKFFFCRKIPIIRLFVYPIKGAHGGTQSHNRRL